LPKVYSWNVVASIKDPLSSTPHQDKIIFIVKAFPICPQVESAINRNVCKEMMIEPSNTTDVTFLPKSSELTSAFGFESAIEPTLFIAYNQDKSTEGKESNDFPDYCFTCIRPFIRQQSHSLPK
jgi:hypothetical protein